MFTTLSSEQSAFIFAQNKFRMIVASPLHVTEENPSRSLLYGDEGIECVTTLMSSAVTSTKYDRQPIPQYGEFFVCRLNLISATSVAWNSSGSETVYGLRITGISSQNPPSVLKGAKWNPQPTLSLNIWWNIRRCNWLSPISWFFLRCVSILWYVSISHSRWAYVIQEGV